MRELASRLWNDPATVRKFLIALLGAVGVAVSVGLLPPAIGPWVTVVTAFATSIGVYAVPNKPDSEEGF